MPRPYELHPGPQRYCSFETEQGLVYTCRFTDVTSEWHPMLGIYDLELVEFMFYPYDPNPKIRKTGDSRIAQTIISMIRAFLNGPDKILLYLCDDSDHILSGWCRQKLFRKWCLELEDIGVLHELEIEVESEAKTLYAGLVTTIGFQHFDLLREHILNQAGAFVQDKYL